KSRLGRHDDGTRNSSSAFSGRRPAGRRPLFPHALRVRPNDGGRDDTPGETSTESGPWPRRSRLSRRTSRLSGGRSVPWGRRSRRSRLRSLGDLLISASLTATSC
ncbi:unnamed protein product, partial [Ectocarpus fasciculatus]